MQRLTKPGPAAHLRARSVARRLGRLDWDVIERGLWERGYAKTPALLASDECERLIELYSDDTRFRSRVEMARYRFGSGEYKYFAEPLPPIVQDMREEAYCLLVSIANRWMEALGSRQRYPPRLRDFLEVCATRGQPKPAPLLLKYGTDDYNCLHQDLLGDVSFPFQLTCALSRRNVDYTGGEFLLVEQGRGVQSRAEVVTLDLGELVIFATDCRPLAGERGYRRIHLRHGVSRVSSGHRYSLGVIFHNSK
jgi:uncharacterized protein